MRESISPVRLAWLLFGAAVTVALCQVASATQVGVVNVLEDNWKKTDKDRIAYMKAEKAVEDKKAAEMVAQACAQYYLYRITHGTMDAHKVQEKFAEMIATGGKADNKEFVNILGPKLVESMKEVLARQQNPKKDAIVIVNAAIMLPTMAKLKQDDVGNYLVEVIAGKDTHDVVRLYAIKAIKELMPITVQQDGARLDLERKEQNAKRNQDAKHVDALTKFIERPIIVAGLPYGEIEGRRFLRREAIIALAHAGSPAVLAVKELIGKKKSPDGMVAPTLLKVLANNDMQPPPSVQEKVEAAIGLLNMKYPNMPEYNPDLATYLVGKTLVEFATEYNTDLTNFSDKKRPSYLPWKDDARRLQEAIKKHAERNPENLSAKELKHYAESPSKMDKRLLDRVIAYENVVVNELSEDVEKKWRPRVKDGKVFKTLTAPEIRLPAAAEAE
jgi:hypothetical protein